MRLASPLATATLWYIGTERGEVRHRDEIAAVQRLHGGILAQRSLPSLSSPMSHHGHRNRRGGCREGSSSVAPTS